jgi:tetratricopeptide (TPR) repeat protein
LRRTLIAAADLARLARDLRRTDPVTALAVLSWDALRSPDDRISHHRLAADICAQAGDLDAALDHLDRAVALTPAHVQVRGERCELLWRRWNQQSDVRDRTGPLLLEDLAFLHPHDTRGGGTLWLREAYVRKHAGDLAGALRALFAAGKRDQSDLTILLESGRCWRELNSRDSDANVAVIKALALHRIPTLVATGSLAEGDVQRWLDDFDAI